MILAGDAAFACAWVISAVSVAFAVVPVSRSCRAVHRCLSGWLSRDQGEGLRFFGPVLLLIREPGGLVLMCSALSFNQTSTLLWMGVVYASLLI